MEPHSLDKPWRRTPSQVKKRGPGKPEMKWTESQERKLFRLITQANVPFKNIEIAMFEPERPAEPGRPWIPQFAPSKGTCWSHWHKMTDMLPSQMRIKNEISLRTQRKQLEQAFEAYQKRQSRLLSNQSVTKDGVVSPPSQIPSGPVVKATATIIEAPASVGDAETPKLTFEGSTPIDLGNAVLTPKAHETIQPLATIEDTLSPGFHSTTREEDEKDRISYSILSTSTKRRVPVDHDEAATGDCYHHAEAENSAAELYILSSGGPSNQAVSLTGGPDRKRGASSLLSVEEETEQSRKFKFKAGNVRTMSGLETKMGVQPGFISFVKYGLTKSRWSVQSALSRISGRHSQSLPTEAEALQESEPFYYANHMSITTQPQTHPAQIQHTEPQLYAGPQKTNVFLALQLAGATDNEIAQEIRQLLEGCAPELAQRNASAPGPDKKIPLEVALGLGNIPACKVLMEFGADVKATTSEGLSLREFGRRASKNATSSQEYYAIGTCRHVILEDRITVNPRTNVSNKRAKLKTRAKNPIPGAERFSTGRDRDLGTPVQRPSVPTWLSSGDHENVSSTTQMRRRPQEHGKRHSRQTNSTSSLQHNSGPAVAELIRHFDQGTQHIPVGEVSGSNPLNFSPNRQSWNWSYDGQVMKPSPAIMSKDGLVNGHWEILPGNRRAFILNDSPDNSISNQTPQMPPHRTSGSDVRYSFNHIPYPLGPPAMGNMSTSMFVPELFPGAAESSMNHSHQNMMQMDMFYQMDPSIGFRPNSMRAPWQPTATAMPFIEFHQYGMQEPAALQAISNTGSNGMQGPLFNENYQNYPPLSNAPQQLWNHQPPSNTLSRPDSTFMDIPPPIDFDYEVNALAAAGGSNPQFVEDWDWQRPAGPSLFQ